jgi:mono/diheme cytochrome c family protein
MTFASCCKHVGIDVLLLGACLLAGRPSAAGSVNVASEPADAAIPCPQPRNTQHAPGTYQVLRNPLDPTGTHLAQGRAQYERHRAGGSCASCHGLQGDGRGPDGAALVPPPRDFTCAATMDGLSDGQLFWIIENGSGAFHRPARQGAQQVLRPGRRHAPTAMTSYARQLSRTEIWQLVLYLRSMARSDGKR